MSDYLCISAIFLDPFFHGRGNGEEPEWPPSPMRVFQALIAGSRNGRSESEWLEAREAFLWLEKQKPFLIVAPLARQAASSQLFVPNNDSDATFERQDRLTAKKLRPHRMLNRTTLHYLWEMNGGEQHSVQRFATAICKEARRLLALGWGIDQVVGEGRIITECETGTLPGERWHILSGSQPGRRSCRVPMEGSLNDLEKVHLSFLNRVEGRQYSPPLAFKKYAPATCLRGNSLPMRSFARFELPEGIAFRQEDSIVVAAMLRSLTCRHAKVDSHKFPCESDRYVAGHIAEDDRGQPRFSYLPLPTIGGAHADGLIRRLLIAEPFGGDGAHSTWAQNRLPGSLLKDRNGNALCSLLDLWRPSSEEMLRRYVAESRTWCSVTPVILPGFDDFNTIANHNDKRPTKAERLFFKCLKHAGIPVESVANITLQKAPFWPGSQHPQCYRRPDYLADHRARPGWHVQLAFHEPFAGPLAIGAGRHCGLGIFAGKDQS